MKAATGCEVMGANDVNNCGGCGKMCPVPQNAAAACTNSVCSAACKFGFGDCDKDVNDGCEVNLMADVNNCGGCSAGCGAVANGTPGCNAGKCGIGMCNNQFADCNGNAGDGCEINAAIDAKNCGGCGKACAPANAMGACLGGQCGIASCNAGFADCNNQLSDGCEIDTQGNANNCGGCGIACGQGKVCQKGACISAGTLCPPSAFATKGLPAIVSKGMRAFGTITFDPDGNLLAVADYGPNSLSSVDAATDQVTSLTALPQGRNYVSVAYNPADGKAYVGSDMGDIQSWHLKNKVLAQVATGLAFGNLNTIVFAPQGFGNYGGQLLAGTNSGYLIACNPGNCNPVSITAGAGSLSSMVFSQAGVLYAVDYNTGRVNTIGANGTVSLFIQLAAGIDAITIDEGRQRLYVGNSTANKITIVDIVKKTSSDMAGVYAFSSGFWPSPLLYDCNNTLLYAVDPGPAAIRFLTVP